MLNWYRRWKAERARRKRVLVERRVRAAVRHLQDHMKAFGGVNSVVRGDDQARHVQAHAELLPAPTPLVRIGMPDSRTEAEKLEDAARGLP